MTSTELLNIKIEIEANCSAKCADCKLAKKCMLYRKYGLGYYSANDIAVNFDKEHTNEKS